MWKIPIFFSLNRWPWLLVPRYRPELRHLEPHIHSSTPVLHPLNMLPCAKSLQHICPQLLKEPWVSFSPLQLVWHRCVGKILFQNTSSQLSPDGTAQENPLCLRPGSLSSAMPISQKGMENPAAGNQSASYQHSLECEQDKQVQRSPLVHDMFDTTT